MLDTNYETRQMVLDKESLMEKKTADRALQDSEKRYRRLFEYAKDGILILDAETGNVVDVNPFLLQLLGHSYDEIHGRHLWEIGAFQDIAASKTAFKKLQDTEYIRYDNLPLKTREGKSIEVEFVSNMYLVDHKKVIQCNIRDITGRKQHLSPLEIDLNETIGGMLKMLQRLIGEDIHLTWLSGAGLWPIMMDPSQLDQILANLCINGRDAIAGVGKITIETSIASFDDAYCATHAGFVPGYFVVLAVSDDGCGMSKETQDHIFEPFYTTKRFGVGTGLGLSTVYGIVNQNNGFINFTSEPDKGTVFKIFLRRHQGEAAAFHDGPCRQGKRSHRWKKRAYDLRDSGKLRVECKVPKVKSD